MRELRITVLPHRIGQIQVVVVALEIKDVNDKIRI